MIDSFRRIGEEISKDFKNLPDIERKKAVLDCLTIPVREKYNVKKDEQRPIYEIIINFDTKNNLIEFQVGSQLRKTNRKKYFGFSVGSGTNAKRIHFTTNKLSYHFTTIPDTVIYIDEIKKSNNNFTEFKNFLENIRDNFYVKNGNGYVLNYALYSEPATDVSEFISKKIGINKGDLKNFNIYSLYFDGKPILETKYFESYILLRYYHSIERFFNYYAGKGLKDKKISHLSGCFSQVTESVDTPIKIYITDKEKPSMFENTKIGNSYKSFSLSQKEYEELLIGSRFVLENLNEKFKDIFFLFIPKTENFFNDIKESTDFLNFSIQKITGRGIQKDYEKLKSLSRRNFNFDMMFYERDQSAFNIFKIVSDISTLRLNEIGDSIDKINSIDFRTKLNKHLFSLNTIWGSLYSQIIKSIKKDKQKNLYRSDFLDYLEIIYSGRFSKNIKFVQATLKNIKKGYYENKKKEDKNYPFLIWDSFESLLFFRNLNLVRGAKMENERKGTLIQMKNEKIQDFFDNYSEIFGDESENGREKKGLVLLGCLVNQIIWAQNCKNKNRSSTFLDKINFDGFKKERLQTFINEVIEFLKLYSSKKKPLLDYNRNLIASMQEYLINLQASLLKKEEITYYILLGNFVGSQIGYAAHKEKIETGENCVEILEEETDESNGGNENGN